MIQKEFVITSEIGLHARPATQLVQVASRYSSEVELEYENKKVNLKSIMGVMSLGIPPGGKFQLIIEGNDEIDAYQVILELLKNEGIAKPSDEE